MALQTIERVSGESSYFQTCKASIELPPFSQKLPGDVLPPKGRGQERRTWNIADGTIQHGRGENQAQEDGAWKWGARAVHWGEDSSLCGRVASQSPRWPSDPVLLTPLCRPRSPWDVTAVVQVYWWLSQLLFLQVSGSVYYCFVTAGYILWP